MNDERSDKPVKPTLLERLSAFLTREPEDRDELLELLHGAFEHKLLDADALSMIEGVLQVSEMTVRDIMIPRAQMDVVSIDDDPAEFLPLVLETKHSRFPVIGENKDDIVGILLAKELLLYYRNPDSFDLKETLRPAVFVPESKRLNVLLRDFRANRNHIAIVVDEYGGVSGLVTIEDVLEQIVGDIEDEYDFDESEDNIIAEANGRFRVKAQTEIGDFNAHFGTDFADDEFDTVGGLVLQAFGRLPKRGETTTIGDFRFRVVRADSRRLYTLQIEPVATARRPSRARQRRRASADGADRTGAARRPRMSSAGALRAARSALAGGRGDGVRLRAVRPRRSSRSSRSALLIALWQGAASARAAAAVGFAFGLGLVRRGRVLGLHRAQHVRRHAARRSPRSAPRASALSSRSIPRSTGWLAVRWTAPRFLARGQPRRPQRGRSPNGRGASSSPAFRGSRSAIRVAAGRSRQARWPGMRRSAACS